MRKKLIEVTGLALLAVNASRFFRTERGFQGRFYCTLQAQLDYAGLLNNGSILEMEYQKSARHGLRQRPDIILHVPTEHSGECIKENNFAVWALKRQATSADARDDFHKLDEMFDQLDYPIGFFINIDACTPMRQHYKGEHGTKLNAVATQLVDNEVIARWAYADAEG